jgi:hypothetical protein
MRPVFYLLAGFTAPFVLAMVASHVAVDRLLRADATTLGVGTLLIGLGFALALFGWKPSVPRIAAVCVAAFLVSFSANEFIWLKVYWVVVIECVIVAVVLALSGARDADRRSPR